MFFSKDMLATLIIFVILLFSLIPSIPILSKSSILNYNREELLSLAIETYEWMMQFQVTPANYSWGWHLKCPEAWGGLAGYYTKKYRWAALYGAESSIQMYIASHDTGWFLELGVKLYKLTGNKTFLTASKLAAEWALRIQIGYSEWLNSFKNQYFLPIRVDNKVSWKLRPGIKFPKDVIGAYTEGMFVFSGKPPSFDEWGIGEDFAEPALWIAPEHVNPIVRGLLELYEVTGNTIYLTSALRAIDFLLRMTSDEGGVYTSYPPETYGIRMGDTAETAITLFKAYKILANKTYFKYGINICEFMLSKIRYQPPYGLPHLSTAGGEWRKDSLFTEDAASAIEAFLLAYNLTGDGRYLTAAENLSKFILSMQSTSFQYDWGIKDYAYDVKAVGGFFWACKPKYSKRWSYRIGYSIISYEFISTASSALIALLKLYKIDNREDLLKSIDLGFEWIMKMRFKSGNILFLPGLKVKSDPHGLYRSGYIPSLGRYYDEVEGTMCGNPEQGFCVAMSAAGPCYLFIELIRGI